MFKKITRKNLEKFLARHATGAKTLDVGSGGSSYGKYFPNRVTVDIDSARKPDIVGDVHRLPFGDESFDCVLCTEMLEHVLDPKVAISEMRRVLVSGGTLILTTRFVYPLHDVPHDYWRFTKYGLLKLFEEWEVVELIAETRSFSTIGALLQRIVFQSTLRFNKPSKLFLLVLAWLSDHSNWLLRAEFGDIKKETSETDIMPCGYCVVCKKK